MLGHLDNASFITDPIFFKEKTSRKYKLQCTIEELPRVIFIKSIINMNIID